MSDKKSGKDIDRLKEFNEHDKKEPISMLSWFTEEELDKKAYWIFIIVLFIVYVIGNIPVLFR